MQWSAAECAWLGGKAVDLKALSPFRGGIYLGRGSTSRLSSVEQKWHSNKQLQSLSPSVSLQLTSRTRELQWNSPLAV